MKTNFILWYSRSLMVNYHSLGGLSTCRSVMFHVFFCFEYEWRRRWISYLSSHWNQWKRTRLSRKQASPGCHDSNKVPSRKLASASQWKVTNFQIGDTSLYGRFSIFNIFMLVFRGVQAIKKKPCPCGRERVERFSFCLPIGKSYAVAVDQHVLEWGTGRSAVYLYLCKCLEFLQWILMTNRISIQIPRQIGNTIHTIEKHLYKVGCLNSN